MCGGEGARPRAKRGSVRVEFESRSGGTVGPSWVGAGAAAESVDLEAWVVRRQSGVLVEALADAAARRLRVAEAQTRRAAALL
eukprot:7274554-Prymnesium_polylepis.1